MKLKMAMNCYEQIGFNLKLQSFINALPYFSAINIISCKNCKDFSVNNTKSNNRMCRLMIAIVI